MHPVSPFCFLPDRTEYSAVLTSSEARPLSHFHFTKVPQALSALLFPFYLIKSQIIHGNQKRFAHCFNFVRESFFLFSALFLCPVFLLFLVIYFLTIPPIFLVYALVFFSQNTLCYFSRCSPSVFQEIRSPRLSADSLYRYRDKSLAVLSEDSLCRFS